MTAQNYTGDRLGPYRLIERLGEGGMGVVYLAADSDQRKVAVKALRPAVAADPNARRRLAREVETMRRGGRPPPGGGLRPAATPGAPPPLASGRPRPAPRA